MAKLPALQAASSDTSTYITREIQASYAIVPDFFNGLLVLLNQKKMRRAAISKHLIL